MSDNQNFIEAPSPGQQRWIRRYIDDTVENSGFGTGAGVTWEDVGSGAQTMALPSFALTGNFPATVSWGDEEFLDFGAGTGDVHFSTTDATVFDNSVGRARILVPGLYQIRCQVNVYPAGNVASDARAQLLLQYAPVSGFSIEVPWYSGFYQAGGGEQARDGDQFVYPSGTGSSYDIGLERLHPISLTDAPTYPISIKPSVTWIAPADPGHDLTASWLGLWGFRIGDNLDAYHSD